MNKLKVFFSNIGNAIAGVFVPMNGKKSGLKLLTEKKGFESATSSVIAALLGLVFGLVLLLISNPSVAFAGFAKILIGGFSGGARGVGNVLYYATPLIMTGLAVGFAFKTGLFDIGASGQFTMGFCFSLFTANLLKDTVTGNVLWIICLLAGMVGGMIWGAIPGIFKALLNVNEVITCIMTNYIGLYFVDMIIRDNPLVYNDLSKWTKIMPANSDIPKMGLDKLFPGSYANGGIIIAIIFAIIIFIVLEKTTFGYELKACGLNKDSARYAGINQNKSIILSMVIAGGLAGIGGALNLQAGTSYTYAPVNVMDSNGFNGIAVALLGVSNPIGTIVAGIFFAHIKQGGFYMQTLGIRSEIIDTIIGATIYFAAFALIVKNYLPKIIAKFGKKKKQTAAATVEAAAETAPVDSPHPPIEGVENSNKAKEE